MAPSREPTPANRLNWAELVLPLGIVACLLVILAPLPPAIIDVLLAANISAAVIILLTTVYVRSPLEFNVFPTLLLTTTLARLVLNVATTRLILSRGATDAGDAAGQVIQSFGHFVAGNNLVVGMIMFGIIVTIQFVVITKGATRISEVAARFALDGLPGRQMAVDSELAAGLIDQAEAQRRRQAIAQQADFYGAMDGASKFVRGDAIAGLVIIAINIIGGLAIGLGHGMPLSDAVQTFTMLTIGEGLACQVPAFLITLAAGILVTRSAESVNLPAAVVKQIVARPLVLVLTAGFLAVLMLTRMPFLPLLAVAALCIIAAHRMSRREKRVADTASRPTAAAGDSAPPIERYLAIDPLEIELGAGLLGLADASKGGDLLDRITGVRKALAAELGIVLPKVRLRDNLALADDEYQFRINNVAVARGTIEEDAVLAVPRSSHAVSIAGNPTTDPETGKPSLWIKTANSRAAREAGYRVMGAAAVIAVHFHRCAVRHAADLLTRDATASLIRELKKTAPTAVDDLVPKVLSLGQIQQVLQRLLAEGVSIRPLALILETLGNHAPRTSDIVELVEKVRQRMAATIMTRYRDARGKLRVVRLDPTIESLIAHHSDWRDGELVVSLEERQRSSFFGLVRQRCQSLVAAGEAPILLVGAKVRPAVKRLVETDFPDLVVLSDREVTRDTHLESLAVIGA